MIRVERLTTHRATQFVLAVAASLLMASCAPGIVIQNSTSFPVRAIIQAGGMTDVFSPSPGESSYAEVREGRYTATVIPDAEWIEYARATRQYLNDQLAHSENLTGPQLLDVIRRLKDIPAMMYQFERAARSSAVGAATCSGAVSAEADGLVKISTNEDGRIFIDCK